MFEIVNLVTLIGFVGALLAGIASLLNASAVLKRTIFGIEEKGPTIEDRVRQLTRSLEESVQLISNIEQEIKARSSLATQLQNDIEQYNQLVQLKKPEVEAVAQLLRGELKKENKNAFWKGFALNFLFFILGAAASWIINILTMK